MAHPIMFDEADPVLGRLRALALAFPDAAEKISHGHPAFLTTKVFAYYGGSIKVDGEYVLHERSVVVLVEPDERLALLRGRTRLRPGLPRPVRMGGCRPGRGHRLGGDRRATGRQLPPHRRRPP